MNTEKTEQAARILNGIITITNRTTEEHRTFQIKTQSEDSSFAPGKRVVALLSGPDNESDYRAFGFVDDENGVTVWRKFRSDNGKPSHWEYFADMISVQLGGFESRYDKEYIDYYYLLAGRCLRCNRRLTTPESIKRGIGPYCAGVSN